VAPVAPQQRHHDDPPRANRLRARDLLRDFDTTELSFTTRRRPIWELLSLS
jgi:hypothetical protein